MGGHETLGGVEAVDPGGVLQVAGVGVLAVGPEPLGGLPRPRVAVEDRNLHDAGPQVEARAVADGVLDGFQLGHEVSRRQPVGIEADLVGHVCRADVDHAVDPPLGEGRGDRHGPEVGGEVHLLVELHEDVVVPAEAAPDHGLRPFMNRAR